MCYGPAVLSGMYYRFDRLEIYILIYDVLAKGEGWSRLNRLKFHGYPISLISVILSEEDEIASMFQVVLPAPAKLSIVKQHDDGNVLVNADLWHAALPVPNLIPGGVVR